MKSDPGVFLYQRGAFNWKKRQYFG